MLTRKQEKFVRSLQTKKGRRESGFCLIEGEKLVNELRKHIVFPFTNEDTKEFKKLVTTKTPQGVAAVARIPEWSLKQVEKRDAVIVLDHVQDPGNIGTILRLCLGFEASLILVESADVTNPKVVRSSVGALFSVPHVMMTPEEAEAYLTDADRDVYRLEKRKGARMLSEIGQDKAIFVAGSEGQGISLRVDSPSVYIPHHKKLESLNVASSVGMVLYSRY